MLIGRWIDWPIPQSITLKYRKDTKRTEQMKAHCNKPVFFEVINIFFLCFLFTDYTPCGVSPVDLRARVVGGKSSKRGWWPWQIGLRRVNSKCSLNGKFPLSGSFIECCIYQESMTNIFIPTFGKSFLVAYDCLWPFTTAEKILSFKSHS